MKWMETATVLMRLTPQHEALSSSAQQARFPKGILLRASEMVLTVALALPVAFELLIDLYVLKLNGFRWKIYYIYLYIKMKILIRHS